MRWKCVCLFLAATASALHGLAAEPPEETETLIACQLTHAPRLNEVPVFALSKECEECKGTYHYRLWLPKGYHAAPQRRWPCVFVASGGGNPKMGPMAGWLKSNGYIVVMLVESKNGPWAPIIGNFLAAHDDVTKRFRVQDGWKVAVGMSGGARACSVFVQIRRGFCGLILQGGGLAFDAQNRYIVAGLRQNEALRIAMTMGRSDFNRSEAERVKNLIPAHRFLLLEFDGGHVWAPPEVFEKAIAWIEHGLCEDGPTLTARRPVYLTRFAILADKANAAAEPAERRKNAEAAIAYAHARNLLGDPAVAAQVATWRAAGY